MNMLKEFLKLVSFAILIYFGILVMIVLMLYAWFALSGIGGIV